MSDYISSETLASGAVLLHLKYNLIKETTEENLFPLLSCLRDSIVLVPFNTIMSEEDQARIVQCSVGDTFKSNDQIRLKPDILKRPDGSLFFPLFSQEEQIPEEYKRQFSVMPVTALQCLQMAHATKDVEGLVLDAFTEPLMLPFQFADIMEQLPSRLPPDSNEQ